MKDIAGAYAEEQAYLSDKLNGIDTSFPARLEPYGFTLSEYHTAKPLYSIQRQRPHVVDFEMTELVDMAAVVTTYDAALSFPYVTKPTAFVGLRKEIIADAAAEAGVDVVYTPFRGGTIIEMPEDLHIVLSTKTLGISPDFWLTTILGELRRFEPDSYIDGNDLMLYGYKVGGASITQYTDKTMYGCSIAFSDVSALASRVIPPRSVKPVGFIAADVKAQLKSAVILAFNGVV